MDPLSSLERASLHPVDKDTATRREARKVAEQFEGVLLRSLVQSLRQTADLGGEDGGMFGKGPGADTYADWFDQHVTDQLSHSGKVGVADVLMREFERWKQIPAEKRGPGLLQVDRDVLRRRDLPVRGALTPFPGGIDVAA